MNKIVIVCHYWLRADAGMFLKGLMDDAGVVDLIISRCGATSHDLVTPLDYIR
jgi:hypothetical protein